MKKSLILEIYNSKNSVFSIKEIALLEEARKSLDPKTLKTKIYRYIKTGKLYPIRRGFYAKDKNYNKLELVTKIYTPSYVSFETVLGKEGVTFQHYGQIFIASYLNREIKIDGQIYIYRKIKDSVLTNNIGIEYKDNYFIATPERAFLDTLYLNKDYHFDNLSTLNWDRIYEIIPIYSNKRMEKKIKKIYEIRYSNS